MKIIILGAGQVGGTLAEQLADESFDITVVDTDEERLQYLRDHMDIQTIHGMASHPQVLEQAGADDADMLIAVTNSDEVNIVACQVSYSLFRTPTKIARVRHSAYHDHADLFASEHMPIDVLINPEQVVTDRIQSLLAHPGALQVLDFADGRVQLVGVRAVTGGALVGHQLSALKEHVPNVNTKVAAIFRRDAAIEPTADTVIEEGDEIFFIAARNDIRTVMSELREQESSFKRIIIAGGGNIGERLSRAIERDYSLKIIERSPVRARRLSEMLSHAVILNGDATDEDLLLEENVELTDVFCALTNDDEANIMSSLLAKRLGVRRTMALIGKPAYVDLVQGGQIDIAISPQQATISSLLNHVRRADVVRAHRIRRGAAEVIEAIAHGDATSSKVVGKAVEAIRFPPGTSVGAVVRGDDVHIGNDKFVIESEDHVILFLTDKSKVREVERLFQVGLSFF